jgi:two-component system chemotaxis response regulator CheY
MQQSRNPRIETLIVDDSAMMRQLLSYALSSFRNVSITEAADGIDALRMCEFMTPDVIITDLSMEGMGGLKLISQLRSSPDLACVPIIVVSTDENAAAEALRLGASTFLCKPLKIAMLRHVFQSFMPQYFESGQTLSASVTQS